jgi:hypothetical protein
VDFGFRLFLILSSFFETISTIKTGTGKNFENQPVSLYNAVQLHRMGEPLSLVTKWARCIFWIGFRREMCQSNKRTEKVVSFR